MDTPLGSVLNPLCLYSITPNKLPVRVQKIHLFKVRVIEVPPSGKISPGSYADLTLKEISFESSKGNLGADVKFSLEGV